MVGAEHMNRNYTEDIDDLVSRNKELMYANACLKQRCVRLEQQLETVINEKAWLEQDAPDRPELRKLGDWALIGTAFAFLSVGIYHAAIIVLALVKEFI